MAYSCSLFFDKDSNGKIFSLYEKAEDTNYSNLTDREPSVSLYHLKSINELSLVGSFLEDFSKKQSSLTINFSKLVIHNSRDGAPYSIVLEATPNKKLNKMHNAFNKKLESNGIKVMSPPDYVPGLSIAEGIRETEIDKIFDKTKKGFIPISASVKSMGLIQYSPYRILLSVELS